MVDTLGLRAGLNVLENRTLFVTAIIRTPDLPAPILVSEFLGLGMDLKPHILNLF